MPTLRREATAATSDLVSAIESEVDRMVRTGRKITNTRSSKIHPGLTPLGYSILLLLAQLGPSTQQDVTLATGVDKSAVSKTVRQLLGADLISQQQSQSDRRQRLLALTPLAQARVAGVLDDRRNDFLQRFEGWSSADLDQFRALLGRYNDNVVATFNRENLPGDAQS